MCVAVADVELAWACLIATREEVPVFHSDLGFVSFRAMWCHFDFDTVRVVLVSFDSASHAQAYLGSFSVFRLKVDLRC